MTSQMHSCIDSIHRSFHKNTVYKKDEAQNPTILRIFDLRFKSEVQDHIDNVHEVRGICGNARKNEQNTFLPKTKKHATDASN